MSILLRLSGDWGEFISQGSPTFPKLLRSVHTEDEAAEAAVDLLREALRGRIRDGEGIPRLSEGVSTSRSISAPVEMVVIPGD